MLEAVPVADREHENMSECVIGAGMSSIVVIRIGSAYYIGREMIVRNVSIFMPTQDTIDGTLNFKTLIIAFRRITGIRAKLV
jgi:hypothetical protein